MPNTNIWSCRNQSYNHIKKAQHLHLINTWSKKGSTFLSDQHMIEYRYCTYIWSTHDRRKAHPTLTSNLLIRKARPTLTSDHVGTNPIIILESPNTYIWSTHDRRKALHLHLINTWSKKGSALTSTQAGTHPAHNDGRACTHIWSCRN